MCSSLTGGGNCRIGLPGMLLQQLPRSLQLLYARSSCRARREPFEVVTSLGVHNELLSKKNSASPLFQNRRGRVTTSSDFREWLKLHSSKSRLSPPRRSSLICSKELFL